VIDDWVEIFICGNHPLSMVMLAMWIELDWNLGEGSRAKKLGNRGGLFN
jgi:hypothetical protein